MFIHFCYCNILSSNNAISSKKIADILHNFQRPRQTIFPGHFHKTQLGRLTIKSEEDIFNIRNSSPQKCSSAKTLSSYFYIMFLKSRS